jgi:outer membrane protein TolC
MCNKYIKNMKNKHFICMIFSLMIMTSLHAQDNKVLKMTMEEAIELAHQQSPSVIIARHNFHAAYWDYRSFRASYLPLMTFNSSPNFNHQINAITMPDGTLQFVQQNMFTVSGSVSLSQNIPLTGGTLSLGTSINRLDMFGLENSHSYMTNPFNVSYQQSLNGYNGMKWERKLGPIRYEIAKKNYVEALEDVSSGAIMRFFNLAQAQANMNTSYANYRSVDTMYLIVEGRYAIGRISENDMLQWEIKRLNEETNLQNAKVMLEENIQSFKTYLGIKDTIMIEAVTSNKVPKLIVDPNKALELAFENGTFMLNIKRRELEIESSVASTKAGVGFQADLYAQFGLSKTGEDINTAYKDPLKQQHAQIGIRVPILDWGRGKGRIKLAESSRRLAEIQMEQERIDFEQGVLRMVRQFNLQANQVNIAHKTDSIANKHNEVAQRLYVQGRLSLLELNSAIAEKDAAKRAYVSTLASFWSYYYNLRRLTLYDFEKNMPITEDYKLLLK